ncbi:MAG: 4-hydroxythreonine-4-phosphate dehydrogenase PdxA [Desulfobulbus propionicus]|nr:MAG: 4-hydroxythreonine-4-phosphate dehydrogenase PdxA [Desulfobulbus propionicus]
MGCPVGIGPEIVVKYFASLLTVTDQPGLIVVGDVRLLEQVIKEHDVALTLSQWQPGASIEPATMPVYPAGSLKYAGLGWGRPDAETGRAMACYIETAVTLVQQGWASAIVTCPISKTSLQLAGYHFPGHTEMLAALTGTSRFRMMMTGNQLRVVLVTIHEPLSRVSFLLTRENIRDCIDLTVETLGRDFGITSPRVAVAGFNPHGGEGQMFGDEEERLIAPAIAASPYKQLVSGPWPPDTIFCRAASGLYDAVVAMYHDQGLIPFKMLHFYDGVNVTMGLPLVRTSVDHGTAYDIAGLWQADPASLSAAVDVARKIVRCRTA